MKKIIKLLIWIAIIAGIISLAEFFFLRKISKPPSSEVQINTSETQQPRPNDSTDPAVAEDNTLNNPSSTSSSETTPADPLPAKFLLDMPFYSQAPFSKWDKVHEEMCEEASVLNAGLFLLGKKLSAGDYEKELMDVKKLEEKLFNDYKSTTITQTKQFTDQYFNGTVKTRVIDNPSVEDIESEVAADHPVIIPLSGRDIGNPNFTPPGPIYHMLVVKGYDATNFITNDVGTRKGNSYTYKKEVIMKNMHDWNAKDIHLGAKRVLVLYK